MVDLDVKEKEAEKLEENKVEEQKVEIPKELSLNLNNKKRPRTFKYTANIFKSYLIGTRTT